MCGIHGCIRTYSNFHSFRKHLRRRHFGPEMEETSEVELRSGGGDTDASNVLSQDSTIEIPHGFQLKNSALFLLKAREVHKVSQSSLNEITSEFAAMSSAELETLKVKVFTSLKAAGITPENIAGLREAFSESRLKNPYEELSTEYQQRQFYRENLNLVVSLSCVHVHTCICSWSNPPYSGIFRLYVHVGA